MMIKNYQLKGGQSNLDTIRVRNFGAHLVVILDSFHLHIESPI